MNDKNMTDNVKEHLISVINNSEHINIKTIDEHMDELRQKNIYLYGAGAFGHEIYNMLAGHNIFINGFIDRSAEHDKMQELYNLPVYKPDCDKLTPEIKNNSTIIVSIVLNHEDRIKLFDRLGNLGYKNIIDGQSVRARQVAFNPEKADYKYDDETVKKICDAAGLFEDKESLYVYEANMCAHITRDYSSYAVSMNSEQYFPKDIRMSKGYSRFVDCGAYNGDTLSKYLQNVNNIEAYIGFEPEKHNFQKLSQFAREIKHKPELLLLYPCAVGNSNQVTAITTQAGSSVLINDVNDTQNTLTQTVRLDDVLCRYEPAFIKMDIEGSEQDAVKGAEDIIRSCQPDLAISVYHYIRDYYEVPLLLRKYNPDYCFYMRAHSSCTMETILYATSK